MRTAISNPYNMEAAPKEQTPIELQRNGLRAICHRCGPVQVLVIRTRFLGTIPDRDKPREEWQGKTIRLCGRCNSGIQSPAPVQAKKPARLVEDESDPMDDGTFLLTAAESTAYALLMGHINQLVTYDQFHAAGLAKTSGNTNVANAVTAIRQKMPYLKIVCKTRLGYIMTEAR